MYVRFIEGKQKGTVGTFFDTLHKDTVPEGAVEITEAQFNEFMADVEKAFEAERSQNVDRGNN